MIVRVVRGTGHPHEHTIAGGGPHHHSHHVAGGHEHSHPHADGAESRGGGHSHGSDPLGPTASTPDSTSAGRGLSFGEILSLGVAGLGQEFVPTLDEQDIAMHAMRIPSTSLSQSGLMQVDVERAVAAIPEVAFVYSKTGTAEMATDPMPPNVSDTFIILRPREEWRGEAELDRLIAERAGEMEVLGGGHAEEEGRDHGGHEHGERGVEGHKGKLLKLIELTVKGLPGNNYEFTQPIQMRFNALIAGVSGRRSRRESSGPGESRMRSGVSLPWIQQMASRASSQIRQ